MAWPWRRFEAMFESHGRRMALIRVNELRNAMVAGVWSNSNYDSNTQEKTLAAIDEFYDSALKSIYSGETEYVEEIDEENDPFFAAMKRPKIDFELESPSE